MDALKKAISSAGGSAVVAEACGVSLRAVYKWISAGRLPRTDYTGETNYAGAIARLLTNKGIALKPDDLRKAAQMVKLDQHHLPTLEQKIPANDTPRQSCTPSVQISSTSQATQ